MLLQFRGCLFFCLSFIGCCVAQSELATNKALSDREQEKLVGLVKTIIWKEATLQSVANLETSNDIKVWTHVITKTFDPNGKLISYCFANRCKFKDSENIPPREKSNDQVILKYDKSEKLIEKVFLKQNGFISDRQIFDYGQMGKLSKITDRNEYDEVTQVETYSDNEQLIERKRFSSGLVDQIEKYDNKGRLLEMGTSQAYPENSFRFHFKYNEIGDEVVLLYFGTDIFPSAKMIYWYKNDNQGNWVKRVALVYEVKDGNLEFRNSSIESRTISYY